MSEVAPVLVEEFLEREAGGRHHRAVMLQGLQADVEAVYEELRHDADADPELLDALKLITDYEFRV